MHAIILMSFNLPAYEFSLTLRTRTVGCHKVSYMRLGTKQIESTTFQTATLTTRNISLCNYIFKACANIHMTLPNRIEFILILSDEYHVAYWEVHHGIFILILAKIETDLKAVVPKTQLWKHVK